MGAVKSLSLVTNFGITINFQKIFRLLVLRRVIKTATAENIEKGSPKIIK
jgi:hypothetical protein